MEDYNPTKTPIHLGTKLSKQDEVPIVDSTLYKSLVGIPLCLTATRSDIMYVANFVSRFMKSPKDSHWKKVKRILRYVVGTLNFGLWYTRYEDNHLSGYTGSDFAGNLDDLKITSGYAFHLGNEYDFLGIKEATHCLNIFYKARVCHCYLNFLSSCVVENTID
jgi:hypothetical protein